MLEIKDLVVAYGKVRAVKGISFIVEQGQVVSLLGTNGAGKTTTLRTISGLQRAESGEIWFNGERIDKTPAHQVVTRGLAHSPRGGASFRGSPSRTTCCSARSRARTRTASPRT